MAIPTVQVWPMSKNALVLKHPEGIQLRAEGSHWPEDGFTARMIADGEVTPDQDKAYKE